MKTDRFSSASPRAAAVLLAGLLLAAGLPAAGQFTLRVGGATITFESASKKMAKALALQVKEVQQRFDANRRALRTVPGKGGVPAYPRQEVAGLIARTAEDLDRAIERIQEPRLEALRAWSDEELRRIQEELAPPSSRTAALPAAVARVASLGSLPSPEPASVIAAAPKPETVSAETSNRLLDQVGAVVSRIFLLAEKEDLEVELWVGSTPAPQAMFRFWSQGKIKGATPDPTIVRANGKRKRVLRGLYAYKAAWAKGAVTELIEYPNSAAPTQSERLDLVNGSGFFCCEFSEQYCHHVDNEKECR